MQKEKLSRDEFLGMFREDVIRLSFYDIHVNHFYSNILFPKVVDRN